MSNKKSSGEERRRAPRRPVLESFSLFVSVPKKGGYKLPVHDLSELGMGFDIDLEGEGTDVPIASGEKLEVHFYMNQTLYLPLTVTVVRIIDRNGVRRIGAEFPDDTSRYNRALNSFLGMLDSIADVARLDPAGAAPSG